MRRINIANYTNEQVDEENERLRIKKILCIVIRLENCLKMSTAHNIT